jgi:2'-5' RNA ligase
MSGMTLGVAIEIPEPFGSVIDAARVGYEPSVGRMPAHITLLPPIDVDSEVLPGVIEHLSAVAAQLEPFDVALHGTGTFLPVSPVVFIALSRGISSCERSETLVRSGLLSVESRFPYHPHVTLAHDVDEEILNRAFEDFTDFRAAFTVTQMQLYRLHPVGWLPLQAFAFVAK